MTKIIKNSKNKNYNINKVYPTYFVLGAVALYVILYVVPSIIGIYYSFTDWNRFSTEINFVGIDNYKKLFSSNYNYMEYIKNTLYFTMGTTFAKTVLGIFLALMLNKKLKFKNFHRAAVFFPAILSMLITGLIFKSILHPATGFLNQVLDFIGLDFLEQKWLSNLKIVFKSVMAVDIWKGTGYIMTIFLAGLQAIPNVYYEACKVDGASYLKQLRYVTLPLLMPSIIVTLVLNLVYGLRVFDIIYVLTGGGPGYATEVLYTAVFKEFGKGTYAVGSALSSIMIIFMVTIGAFIVKRLSRNEVDY